MVEAGLVAFRKSRKERVENLLTTLKNTILDLIRELKEYIFIYPNEKGDLFLVEFFFREMKEERIMQHIIDHVLPWKKQIQNKDQNFFLENRNIFKGIPEDRIAHYGQVIVNRDRVAEEDKESVWQYFDVIICLAESYKKVE